MDPIRVKDSTVKIGISENFETESTRTRANNDKSEINYFYANDDNVNSRKFQSILFSHCIALQRRRVI